MQIFQCSAPQTLELRGKNSTVMKNDCKHKEIVIWGLRSSFKTQSSTNYVGYFSDSIGTNFVHSAGTNEAQCVLFTGLIGQKQAREK